MRIAKNLVATSRTIYQSELNACPHCGGDLERLNYLAWDKTVQTLSGVKSIACRPARCANPDCRGYQIRLRSAEGQQISLPNSTYGLDVVVRIGWLLITGHATYPEIQAQLASQVQISLSQVRYLYTRVYLPLLACNERQYSEQLQKVASSQGGLIIALDGIVPEAQQPHIWFMRELTTGLTLRSGWLTRFDTDTFVEFLKPLENLKWPILAILSDKQKGLPGAVKKVLPNVPHQFCQSHYLGNLAEPLATVDSTFKLSLRRAVRSEVGDLIRYDKVPFDDANQQTGLSTMTGLLLDNDSFQKDNPTDNLPKSHEETRGELSESAEPATLNKQSADEASRAQNEQLVSQRKPVSPPISEKKASMFPSQDKQKYCEVCPNVPLSGVDSPAQEKGALESNSQAKLTEKQTDASAVTIEPANHKMTNKVKTANVISHQTKKSVGLPTPEQVITSTNEAITSTNEAITSTNEAITSTNEAITNTNQAITNTNQAITNTNQAITNTNQAITNTNQAITNTHQLIIKTSQPITPSHHAISNTNDAMSNINHAFTNTNQANQQAPAICAIANQATEEELVCEANEAQVDDCFVATFGSTEQNSGAHSPQIGSTYDKENGVSEPLDANLSTSTTNIPTNPLPNPQVESETLEKELANQVITQILSHVRYLLSLKGRPPLRLVGIFIYQALQQVINLINDLLTHRHDPHLAHLQQALKNARHYHQTKFSELVVATNWLDGIREILEPANSSENSSTQVSEALRDYLSQLPLGDTPFLQSFRENLVKVSDSYWPI